MTAGFDVAVVASARELASLEGEWRALWALDLGAVPFTSPDWLLPWWSSFGEGKQLRVITVRQGKQLVCLLPLYRTERGQQRELLLLGTGNSDHLDCVAAPGASAAVAAALNAALELRAEWDVMDLQELASTSPLLGALAPGARAVVQDQCPVVSLTSSRDELPISIDFRRRLSYARRKLARRGPLRRVDADAASCDALLEALVELHGQRWRTKGEAGVLCDSTVREFHRDVARRCQAAGSLELFALEVSGRIAGVFYGFAHGPSSYYYLSGFDPEFEDMSLGSLLIAEALGRAIEQQRSAFDFLRGEEPYKYRWGAVDRPNYRLRLSAAAS